MAREPRIDELNAIGPRRDVEALRLAEVEQHWPTLAQQREDAQGAGLRHDIEIGHAPPQQRMLLRDVGAPEVIADVESRHQRAVPLACFVDRE